MNCTVTTLRQASPRIERPLLTIPDWHSSAGRNTYTRQAKVNRQCRHIADTFREVLHIYRDCGETRLVTPQCGMWYPVTAEELGSWLSRFFYLDGWYEMEQMQRLHAFLISPDSGVKTVN